ncbi:MAG: hypothetical protein K8R88_11530, partial [Armatimonadetes bacterium]|nr:hypothetical protein [Armatimonadota bacterium]
LDYVVPASASFGSGHTIAVYFDGEDFYTAGSKSAPWTVLRPTFRGNANFLDWSASQVGLPLSLIVRNSAGATVQGPTTVLCGNGGTWSLDTTLAAGDYSVSMKGSHWLRKQSALTALNSTTGTGNINLSLKNGDAAPDNVIDLSDYTKVVVAFNALPSSGNWDESADLNGDDVIDLTDYTIVVTNFNLVGDL